MSSINSNMAAAVAATSLQAKQESKDRDRAVNRSREIHDAIVDLSKPLTEDKDADQDPMIDNEMPEQGQAAGYMQQDDEVDAEQTEDAEHAEPQPQHTAKAVYGPQARPQRDEPHAVDVTA